MKRHSSLQTGDSVRPLNALPRREAFAQPVISTAPASPMPNLSIPRSQAAPRLVLLASPPGHKTGHPTAGHLSQYLHTLQEEVQRLSTRLHSHEDLLARQATGDKEVAELLASLDSFSLESPETCLCSCLTF